MATFTRSVAVGVIALAAVGGSIGMAAAETASVAGGKAVTNSADTKLTTTDTKADGVRIYSDYYRSGSGTRYQLITTSNGQAVSSTGSKIYRFNVCRDVPVGLDSCADWVYPS